MNEWTYSEWIEVANREDLAAFYLYTPLCGTCAVASKILNVVTELTPGVPIGKANLNYIEELASEYQVESVPCLLIKRKGKSLEKVYAFQSVQHILQRLS